MQVVRKARRVFRSGDRDGKEEARRLSGSGIEEGFAQNPFSLANSACRMVSWLMSPCKTVSRR